MKFPKLFDVQPTEAEVHAATERLAPHLSGWNKLSELLLMDVVTEEDLKILILLEVSRGTECRIEIVRKLVGRLGSLQRERIMSTVHKTIGN